MKMKRMCYVVVFGDNLDPEDYNILCVALDREAATQAIRKEGAKPARRDGVYLKGGIAYYVIERELI